MDKDEFEEYDWEENVEFEVTNYELVDVMYDVNGNEYIWEYEANDEDRENNYNMTISRPVTGSVCFCDYYFLYIFLFIFYIFSLLLVKNINLQLLVFNIQVQCVCQFVMKIVNKWKAMKIIF